MSKHMQNKQKLHRTISKAHGIGDMNRYLANIQRQFRSSFDANTLMQKLFKRAGIKFNLLPI